MTGSKANCQHFKSPNPGTLTINALRVEVPLSLVTSRANGFALGSKWLWPRRDPQRSGQCQFPTWKQRLHVDGKAAGLAAALERLGEFDLDGFAQQAREHGPHVTHRALAVRSR